MKAVQFSEYGGPEVLQVVDVDEPHAAVPARCGFSKAGFSDQKNGVATVAKNLLLSKIQMREPSGEIKLIMPKKGALL